MNASPLPNPLPTGHVLAHLVVQRWVGRGAGSEVYLALDQRDGRFVALKLARRAGTDADVEREHRFAREIAIARRLEHPDIARALDSGQIGEVQWMSQQWAPGHELTRYTNRSHQLPDALALQVLIRAARALQHAHDHGILHRDLKPANIRVHLPRRAVALLDFGAAHVDDGTQTRTGVLLGTPVYMAPEQLAGAAATPRSDLYALGVIGHELLSGQRPHQASSMGELLRQLASGPATPLSTRRPDLRADLCETIDAAAHREPQSRPATAAAWAEAIATQLTTLTGGLNP